MVKQVTKKNSSISDIAKDIDKACDIIHANAKKTDGPNHIYLSELEKKLLSEASARVERKRNNLFFRLINWFFRK
jgi:hypothetical protein